ncbi:MAG: CocE/NonD family hydrolase [Candidatus Bathyarchaeia archaeon]
MERLEKLQEDLEKANLRLRPYWDRRYLKNVEKWSKPVYKVKEERDIYITMSDGTKICLDVFRPDDEGCFPALVAWGGYGKDLQSIDIPPQPWESYMFNHDVEVPDIKFFVKRGYAVVIPDPRGIGKSEGVWKMPFSREEVQDCYEIIEWAARQSWCDGNLGMIGLSYFGTIQLLVAALQPPHLKAICPWECHYNWYDRNYPGGILTTFLWVWESEVPFRKAKPYSIELYSEEDLKRKVRERLEDPDIKNNPYFYQFLKPWENGGWPQSHPCFFDVILHPTDGTFWHERWAIASIVNRIKIPVYFGGPWYLTAYTVGLIKSFLECTSPHKKLIFFPSEFKLPKLPELKEEILRWYDYWLKGVDTGIMEEPPIKIFVMGVNKWRYEHEWPLARTRWTKLYLKCFNKLEPEPEEEENLPPDAFVHKPPTVSTEIQSLTYITRPLASPLEITGQIVTYIYASIDQEDAAFYATLYDVSPDGHKTAVSNGCLKASHRIIDETKSKPWQPCYLHSSPQPIRPGEINLYPIEMEAKSYVFFPEHRIQLEITSWKPLPSVHHHKMQLMLTLPNTRPTTYKIYRDAKHQSHILLPIISETPEELWIK